MPGYRTLQEEKDAIDCLICHSVAYDMNKRTVVVDKDGRMRWNQDRSMKAAISVTKPTSQACLHCHQHNLGGDTYVDPRDSSFMESITHSGYHWPCVHHPGSKRGTPFSPSWDVHDLKKAEPRWIPNDALLEKSHSTWRKGALTCVNCHSPNEVIDWKSLGYTEDEIETLESDPLE